MSDQPDIPRPPRPPFNATNLPAQLRELPQWTAWRHTWKDECWVKLPIDVKTGQAAKCNNSGTWSTFDEALRFYEESDDLDGLMFAITEEDEFVGIDIDRCIDAAGTFAPEAVRLLREFNTYSEVSPSGTGVKLWIKGKKNHIRCKSKAVAGVKEIEVYDRARFFTLTGMQLPNSPGTIEPSQEQLDTLCVRLWPPQPVPSYKTHTGGVTLDDDTLIKKALAAKNGDKFRRLMAGDTSAHGDDDSAADMAICSSLAFWTRKDASQMDRIFRSSGLFRTKWDSRRGSGTYGSMTIEKAIASCREVYSPERKALPASEPSNAATTPGHSDAASGQLVLDPQRTVPTALAFLEKFYGHPDVGTLVNYGGMLWVWQGNRYVPIEDAAVSKQLQHWLHDALRLHVNRRNGDTSLVPFQSNPRAVKSVLDTIKPEVHLHASTPIPTWRVPSPDRPPPLEILPCKSLNLHIPTGLILPATPALFTMNALEFDYLANAPSPHRWLKFLYELWCDDAESIHLLQEWFGLCLIADTSFQKMLMIIGPRRSGKGVIGRILVRLVGASNVAGPTVAGLSDRFGLQPLINKSLALVSDARFKRNGLDVVSERLLCISGEDSITVDRKFLDSLTLKLMTRFLFLTNEMPMFDDASTALAGRFLILHLTRSFFGKEDPGLEPRLVGELPGILCWALEGLTRLRTRGAFVQPTSSAEIVEQLEDFSSPVKAFVLQHCDVGDGCLISTTKLFEAWGRWCSTNDITPTSPAMFGRDLSAAFSLVRRSRIGADRVPHYRGIQLKGHDA